MSSGSWLGDIPATDRQIERIRELIEFPELEDRRTELEGKLEVELEEGLRATRAWEMIGRLGSLISIERRRRERTPDERELSL